MDVKDILEIEKESSSPQLSKEAIMGMTKVSALKCQGYIICNVIT